MVPQTLITMLHLQWKKSARKKKLPEKVSQYEPNIWSISHLISCDYHDIAEFKKIKIREQQDLSILPLNISSISAHINNLRNFLNLVNQKIDIISILESRISTKNVQTTNIDLPDYNIKQTLTESSVGSALIFISERLSYKTRKDVYIYCTKTTGICVYWIPNY